MISDMHVINGEILIIFLILATEWFLSWKVGHGMKEWGQNNKHGDLNSKLIAGFIIITLNFIFIIGLIIVHSSITNEPINITVIYIALILFISYIAMLTFLLRFKGSGCVEEPCS